MSRANIIVDMGGGNGYVLSQILARGVGLGVSLVNLDYSDEQLDATRNRGNILCSWLSGHILAGAMWAGKMTASCL